MRAPVGVLAALGWLTACGDNADPEVRGAHQTFVMSHQSLPLANTDAKHQGMDIDSDGIVDNQMGMVLWTFHSFGLDIQPFTDRAIDRGSMIQLIDVQIPGPQDGPSAAGFSTALGSNPRPEPCASAEDVVCRRHLQGNGVFDVDPSSPVHPPIPALRDGESWSGQGDALSVMTGFFNVPLRLDLAHAHVSFDAYAGGVTGKIAGGVSKEDLLGKLIPAALNLANEVALRDCPVPDMPPTCGCKADTNGKTLLGLFDANYDCAISLDELLTNSLTVTFSSPDLRLDGVPYLSFGFEFEAVPAVIDLP